MDKNITLGNDSGHYANVGLLRGRLESLEDFKPFAEGILAYAEDSELGLFLKLSSKLLNRERVRCNCKYGLTYLFNGPFLPG
jgi:hypothetical protein